MIKNIPKERLLLYLLSLGLLPVIFAILYFLTSQSEVTTLKSNIQELQQASLIREKKQAANIAVRKHFREADHYYIDKNLETLTFLEPEIESLQKSLSNKNIADDDVIKKRLEFLTSGNTISFAEGVVQSSPLFQEVTETLVHPIEINTDDLQKILAKIEGINIGPYSPGPNPPQLLILDFKLDRKSIHETNEVYILNLKLLKREFL